MTTMKGIVFIFFFLFCVFHKTTAQTSVRPEKVCLFDQISARTNPQRFAGLGVDGDGILQDYMIIESATRDAKVVIADKEPMVFTTVSNNTRPNPCLSGFGLGVPAKEKKSALRSGYVFTFKPGYSTSWFQLRPLDFGDANPLLANSTSLWLTGYSDEVFGGESNVIRRQQEGLGLRKKYDACENFRQNRVEPLLLRAAPGKSFNKVVVNFNYVKGKEVLNGQVSDPEFALVDICYEILVPVCHQPRNAMCACLASHLWEKRAALRVVNQFSQTIHIHWVSDTGVEGRTLSIKAGNDYTINTYLTHAFRIRDNCGELLYEMVVTQLKQDIIVTGVFSKPDCDILCGSRRRPTLHPSHKMFNHTGPTPAPTTPAPTMPNVIPMDPVAPIDCVPIGSPKPEIIELVAAMRDMKKNHPDAGQTFRYERHIVEDFIGVDGKPVYNKTHRSATTTGEGPFDSWFNTRPGTNEEHNLAIPLKLLPNTNIYAFGSSDFFPLDHHLLGDDGDNHNYYWTMEWHTQFTYKGGETFKVTGNDDIWVFVNGALVIDLGGIHGSMSREIDLDELAPKLNLKKGYAYPFAFFYANRKESTSDLHIQTSIVLKKDCVYIRRDKTAKQPESIN